MASMGDRPFLVVQVVVPSWQLTQPRPARFGWQMYAAGAGVAFAVVGRDGAVTPVALEDYIVRRRDDLDLRRYLPPVICARTGAAAVRYRDAASQGPVESRVPAHDRARRDRAGGGREGAELWPVLVRLAGDPHVVPMPLAPWPRPSAAAVAWVAAAWAGLGVTVAAGKAVPVTGALLALLVGYVLTLDQQMYPTTCTCCRCSAGCSRSCTPIDTASRRWPCCVGNWWWSMPLPPPRRSTPTSCPGG